MRISRVFHPFSIVSDSVLELSDSAANHIARVLRLREGAPIIIFDGTGGQFDAEIEVISKRGVKVRVKAFNGYDAESPLEIVLAQGISRGERMDYTIQKAVELGVSQIVPLITEHCNVKLDRERSDKRQLHWQSVIISACEQCGRNKIPLCSSPLNVGTWFDKLTKENTQNSLRIVLNHRATNGLTSITARPKSIVLLVGPEGGLSDTEIQAATRFSFISARLGPRILRTETAALVALASLQTLWGDF